LLYSQTTQQRTNSRLQPTQVRDSNALQRASIKKATGSTTVTWATARTIEGKSWLAAAEAGACCSALTQVSHTVYPPQQPATLHTSHSNACWRSVKSWQMRHMRRCAGALPPPSANGTSAWPLGQHVA
jgi:hypothetical protein